MAYSGQTLAASIGELVKLEEQAAVKAAEANAEDVCRVYEWRPSALPELPAIWNWIDPGEYEIVDTARADDIIVVVATIGVKPSDLGETMGRLLRITDIFRSVVDPELGKNRPLKDTCRYAKRVVTRTDFDDFNGIPVMCMDMLIRLDLVAMIR